MKVISLRISSLILLVLAVLALSGIAITAEALLNAEPVIACCEKEADRSDTGPEPCSTPDCSCTICLTMDLATLSAGSKVIAGEVTFHSHQPVLPLSQFSRSIDQPPESF